MTHEHIDEPAPSASTTLVYQGSAIHIRNEMLSLTDMWRAAGGPSNQRPVDWLDSAEASRFADFLAVSVKPGNSRFEENQGISHSGLIRTIRGGTTSGTWAHWQLGFAYAKYLSPEFHAWCNTVARERMEEMAGKSLASTHLTSREFGGIAKAVVNKALNDRLGPVEQAVSSLADRVAGLLDGYDPRATVTDYRPMLDVLIDHKVPQHRRRQLSQRCSTLCRRWCIQANRAMALRLSRETGRYLFQVDAVREWLEIEGRGVIADHVARTKGQGVLPFRREKQPTQTGGQH